MFVTIVLQVTLALSFLFAGFVGLMNHVYKEGDEAVHEEYARYAEEKQISRIAA